MLIETYRHKSMYIHLYECVYRYIHASVYINIYTDVRVCAPVCCVFHKEDNTGEDTVKLSLEQRSFI